MALAISISEDIKLGPRNRGGGRYGRSDIEGDASAGAEEDSARSMCEKFDWLLSRQLAGRRLMRPSFVFRSYIVLVYCHLGTLKARGRSSLLSSHQNVSPRNKSPFVFTTQITARALSFNLFVSIRTTHPEVLPIYIRHGDNGGMAPTHTPASASQSSLTSANSNHGLLRTTRRRQLLHPTIPLHSQIARIPPLR